MRLLVITQVLDVEDPVLGFFHRWLEEFVSRCSSVAIIALKVGKYHLLPKVKVLSLGKEVKSARLHYVLNFYRYVWQLRKRYDIVFIHMNPEYVLLAGWWWKLTGKKVWLWRNHSKGGLVVRLAALMADRVFCTSPQSFVARYAKTEIMPMGIDTEYFSSQAVVQSPLPRFLYLGRLSPVKNIEIMLRALGDLSRRGMRFSFRIVGVEAGPGNREYLKSLQKLAEEENLSSVVEWRPMVSNQEARQEYLQASIFLNATASGSFDKTIGEAMACGTLTVVSNQALRGLLDDRLIFEEGNKDDLVRRLIDLTNLSESEKESLCQSSQKMIQLHHSLPVLAQKLFN